MGGAYNTTTHSLDGTFPVHLSDYVTPTKEEKRKENDVFITTVDLTASFCVLIKATVSCM